ncbi:MAG TPA: L-threonylcarbamoyladenylate synthase [Actinomycetota bacterium]|nr:L-threonylcarbamoyladenylate synthase [Actinomycetota bacterium]
MSSGSSIEDVAAVLQAGRLAVVPTDTVYGLAASLGIPAAVQEIFTAKGRPEHKPLPVLGTSIEQLRRVAVFGDHAQRLARRFWPGPLTLILERAEGFDVDLGGDEARTVGVRVPKEPRTLQLLAMTGPLAVTSANLSGAKEASTVDEARSVFGSTVAAYLDGGRCVAVPSTVVYLAGERRILREGPVAAAAIAQILSE